MATSLCWNTGICADVTLKPSGVMYPATTKDRSASPDRAEMILFVEFRNTCEPAPGWFRAEDPEMEAAAKEGRGDVPLEHLYPVFRPVIRKLRSEGVQDEDILTGIRASLEDLRTESHYSEEQIERFIDGPGGPGRDAAGSLHVYLHRADFDCSRVAVRLDSITLNDRQGVELHGQEAYGQWKIVDPTATNSPSGKPSDHVKILIPVAYLGQIEKVKVDLSFQRVWQKAMKRVGSSIVTWEGPTGSSTIPKKLPGEKRPTPNRVTSYIIHLRNHRTFKCDNYWHRGDQINCQSADGAVGVNIKEVAYIENLADGTRKEYNPFY